MSGCSIYEMKKYKNVNVQIHVCFIKNNNKLMEWFGCYNIYTV